MKVGSLVLAMIFVSSVTYAQCDEPVSYLRKGQIVNCSGYLFSEEKEKQVREMVNKYPILLELTSKQEHLINKLNDRVELNQQISTNLRGQLENRESNNRLQNIIYFTLGLVVGITVNKINK